MRAGGYLQLRGRAVGAADGCAPRPATEADGRGHGAARERLLGRGGRPGHSSQCETAREAKALPRDLRRLLPAPAACRQQPPRHPSRRPLACALLPSLRVGDAPWPTSLAPAEVAYRVAQEQKRPQIPQATPLPVRGEPITASHTARVAHSMIAHSHRRARVNHTAMAGASLPSHTCAARPSAPRRCGG